MKSLKNAQLVPKKAKEKKKRKRGTKKRWRKWKTNIKMVDLNVTISVITLNGMVWISQPYKRQKMIRWDEKLRPKYRQLTLNINT